MKIIKKVIAVAFAVAIVINNGILNVFANSEQLNSEVKQIDLYAVKDESYDIFESEVTETQQDLLCPCMKNAYCEFSNLKVASDEENEINISYPENTLYEYTLSGNIINLSDYEYITNSAFSNMNKEFTVKIDSDNPPIIEEYALSNPNLSCIMLDNEELSYTDLQLKDDEYYITCGSSHAGVFKDESSFKVQLIKAVINNRKYSDKLEDDFCKKLIEDNNWHNLAKENPYDAYYSIYCWVGKNRPYMGWWTETTKEHANISYNNKYYFDYSQIMSSTTLSGIITGYDVCGGIGRTIDDIINNLNKEYGITNLKSIFVGSNVHAWNLIGIKDNSDEVMKWYHSDGTLASAYRNISIYNNFLLGQENGTIKINVANYGIYAFNFVEPFNSELKENFSSKLKEYGISYNYKNQEVLGDKSSTNGVLCNESYTTEKQEMNVYIHNIINNSNTQVSLDTPNNSSSYQYSNKEESQGYYIFSNEKINDIIINAFIKNNNMLFTADFSAVLNDKNNVIYYCKAEFDDGYEIYLYGKRIDNTLDIIVSDKPEYQLIQNLSYCIIDNAKINDVGIKVTNKGENIIAQFPVLSESERDENGTKFSSEYNTIETFTDFSGKIYIDGIEIFDINNYKPEDLMGAKTVLDNCVQRNIGYNITVTYDEETNTKNITLETFDVGDVNANGIIDQDDLTLLLQFLTAEYHFIQTGSDGDLRLEAPNITLNGDIASNGKFYIKANNANFNGTIYANGGFNTEISGAFNCNGQKSGIEFPMDLITETFNDKAMMEWCFKDENIDYSNDENNLVGAFIYNDEDKYIEDINESYMSTNNFISFIGNYNVYKNQKSINDLTVSESDIFNANAVLYSEKGNITINSKNCTINGFIYAPNGKVTITSENLNVTGTIVAKEIEVITENSFNFTITKTDEMKIKLTKLQMLLSDLDMNNKINVFDSVILKRKLA